MVLTVGMLLASLSVELSGDFYPFRRFGLQT